MEKPPLLGGGFLDELNATPVDALITDESSNQMPRVQRLHRRPWR